MKTLKSLFILLALPVALSGCQSDMPREWKEWSPQIETQSQSEDLMFSKGVTRVGGHNLTKLRKMTSMLDAKVPAHAKVMTHTTESMAKRYPTVQRVHSIVECLVKLGIERCNIEVVHAGGQKGAHTVTVMVNQHMAKAPTCPGWNYTVNGYIPPEGEIDFGCATAGNLAKMAAYPHDLVEGRGLGNGDGPRNNLSVDMYRTNKTEDLIKNEKIVTTK